MSGIAGLMWPGDGTYKVPASEARVFTIHELAGPRLKDADFALARNGESAGSSMDWLRRLASDLRAMVMAPDRAVTVDDFEWAATARCRCGAGFCYPNFTKDSHGHWFCSALMLGTAPADSEHDVAKPFAFWSIKSDSQPSANGLTTRPR